MPFKISASAPQLSGCIFDSKITSQEDLKLSALFYWENDYNILGQKSDDWN